MKINSSLLAASIVSSLGALDANAAIYFNETFSYADGALVTVAPSIWTTHSGTTPGQVMVSSGSISINDVDTEDVNRQIGATITTGSVFASFDFSVSAAAVAAGGDYEYFFSFGNGTSDFTSRMDITAAGDTGDFRVGIAGAGSTADSTWATDLAFDTFYKAVVGYDRDTGISSVWINPIDSMSTSILSAADTNDVTGVYLRQSASSVNETITIDNLIVANDFTEALTGVPEPSIALLSGLGLLGLIRRRR